MIDGLTGKQERFVQKFIELDNASEAYRQSYEASGMCPEAIHVEACRLLQNPKVALRVKELQDLQLRRHMVTADRIVAEYAKLAFLDIRKAFNDDGSLKQIGEMDDDTAAAIAGLEVESLFEGRGADRELVGRLHKIKLVDKKGALDSLARHLGMAPEKVIVVNQPLPERDKAILDEYAGGKAD